MTDRISGHGPASAPSQASGAQKSEPLTDSRFVGRSVSAENAAASIGEQSTAKGHPKDSLTTQPPHLKQRKIEQTNRPPLVKQPSLEKYHQYRPQGEGSFGSVHTVHETGKAAPLEVLKIMDDTSENRQETETLKQFHHPNIVKIKEEWSDLGKDKHDNAVPKRYLVMSHGGETLKNLVRNHIAQPKGQTPSPEAICLHAGGPLVNPIPLPLFTHMAGQLCDSVSYMHSNGYTHFDLKPANLLVNPAAHLSVCDLGFAEAVRPGEKSGSICGTPGYMAPEMLEGMLGIDNDGADSAADCWSIGCILYELLCGEKLCKGLSDEQDLQQAPRALDRATKGLLGLYYYGKINDQQLENLYNLFTGLLQLDPEKRMTLEQALKNPLFADFTRADPDEIGTSL